MRGFAPCRQNAAGNAAGMTPESRQDDAGMTRETVRKGGGDAVLGFGRIGAPGGRVISGRWARSAVTGSAGREVAIPGRRRPC
jgi:hypothetical protein